MLLEAGFPAVPAGQLADLVVVKLTGLKDGGEAVPIAFKDADLIDVADRSLTRLKALIDRFEDEATPYASRLHPMFKNRRYGDYDHLARVREWSLASEGTEGAAANERARVAAQATLDASAQGLRPARLRLGLRQCGLGQDDGPDPPRHPPPARGSRALARSSA